MSESISLESVILENKDLDSSLSLIQKIVVYYFMPSFLFYLIYLSFQYFNTNQALFLLITILTYWIIFNSNNSKILLLELFLVNYIIYAFVNTLPEVIFILLFVYIKLTFIIEMKKYTSFTIAKVQLAAIWVFFSLNLYFFIYQLNEYKFSTERIFLIMFLSFVFYFTIYQFIQSHIKIKNLLLNRLQSNFSENMPTFDYYFTIFRIYEDVLSYFNSNSGMIVEVKENKIFLRNISLTNRFVPIEFFDKLKAFGRRIIGSSIKQTMNLNFDNNIDFDIDLEDMEEAGLYSDFPDGEFKNLINFYFNSFTSYFLLRIKPPNSDKEFIIFIFSKKDYLHQDSGLLAVKNFYRDKNKYTASFNDQCKYIEYLKSVTNIERLGVNVNENLNEFLQFVIEYLEATNGYIMLENNDGETFKINNYLFKNKDIIKKEEKLLSELTISKNYIKNIEGYTPFNIYILDQKQSESVGKSISPNSTTSTRYSSLFSETIHTIVIPLELMNKEIGNLVLHFTETNNLLPNTYIKAKQIYSILKNFLIKNLLEKRFTEQYTQSMLNSIMHNYAPKTIPDINYTMRKIQKGIDTSDQELIDLHKDYLVKYQQDVEYCLRGYKAIPFFLNVDQTYLEKGFNLKEELKQLIDYLSKKYKKNNDFIELNIKFFFDEDYIVLVDKEPFLVVIDELIRNALGEGKYSNSTKVVLELKKENDSITIDVIDNGRGFNKKYPMETYGKVNVSLSKETNGGFGLSQVEKYVEKYLEGEVKKKNNFLSKGGATVSLNINNKYLKKGKEDESNFNS